MNLFALLKRTIILLMLSVFMVGIWGCSTKKNTWNRRVYHNLTSKYNVYWNGNESLRTGLTTLQDNAKDDYMRVLRVYNYGSKVDAQGQYAALDRAIEKASIGVQRHSMVFGGREQVKWIDDSYLMMAKAHFYKQDYTSARRTFEFVSREYYYNDISHTADLWLARTYIGNQQYERAIALLTAIESRIAADVMPAFVEANFDAVFADYYIATENYSKALPYLRRAINAHSDRQQKTRMMFIKAQIYEREGELAQSLEYYKMVISRNPPFDMAFQARINLAKTYNPLQDDNREILKVLSKMLDDERNLDYRDKIYYALAEVALKDQDEELAMDYLKLSVATSVRDNSQKAASALQLADLYFERTFYEPAQAYYDTAVQVLPAEYPGYDSIKGRALVLDKLVVNLQTIKLQDSLLRIAAMDSVQIYAVIDKLIAEHIENERRIQQEEQSRDMMTMMGGPLGGRQNQTGTAPSSGEWYFYNPNTLSFGFTEFLRKWGRRALEDNWRISDQQTIAVAGGISEDMFEGDEAADQTVDPEATPRDRIYYLQSLPRTEQQKQTATMSIIEAYSNVGYIYKEDLNDFKRAKETYITLNERYPDNKFSLQAWYALYRINMEEGNLEQAEEYKELIISSYPDTDYAKILIDPDFYKKLAEEKNQSLDLYANTYNAYRKGQYFRVLMNANRARTLYANDSLLMPKFEFLRAISVGRVEVIDSMAVGLSQLVEKYPSDELSPMAIAILRQLNQDYNLNIELPEELMNDELMSSEPPSPYTFEPRANHLVMIITNSVSVRIDPLKVRISDFNSRSFRNMSLVIRSIMLDKQRSLITVGNFEDRLGADDYWATISASDYVFGGMEPDDFHVYPISSGNYPVFYRQKDIDQYNDFWEKNYK
jgi:tetratricopeptide (TPR) repeat protein